MVGAMYAGDSAPAVPGPVVPSAFALSRTASLASANAGTVASTAPAPAPRRAARLASADKDKSGKTKQKLLSALGFNSNATRRPAISQPLPPTASAAASAVQEKERQQNMDRIRHAAQTLKLGGQQIVRRLRKKLSSKTPKEELPKTWEEYSKRYVNVRPADENPFPSAAIDVSGVLTGRDGSQRPACAARRARVRRALTLSAACLHAPHAFQRS